MIILEYYLCPTLVTFALYEIHNTFSTKGEIIFCIRLFMSFNFKILSYVISCTKYYVHKKTKGHKMYLREF